MRAVAGLAGEVLGQPRREEESLAEAHERVHQAPIASPRVRQAHERVGTPEPSESFVSLHIRISSPPNPRLASIRSTSPSPEIGNPTRRRRDPLRYLFAVAKESLQLQSIRLRRIAESPTAGKPETLTSTSDLYFVRVSILLLL